MSSKIKSISSINDHQSILEELSIDYQELKVRTESIKNDLNSHLKELSELKEIHKMK